MKTWYFTLQFDQRNNALGLGRHLVDYQEDLGKTWKAEEIIPEKIYSRSLMLAHVLAP